LTWFATFKYAPTFDLKSKRLTVTNFGGVVACLSCARKFNAENAGYLVLGNLSGYAQWLASKDAVSLSKFLCLSQYFEYGIGVH